VEQRGTTTRAVKASGQGFSEVSKTSPKSGKTFPRKSEKFFTPEQEVLLLKELFIGYHWTISASRNLA
jgi:hypothetical protein